MRERLGSSDVVVRRLGKMISGKLGELVAAHDRMTKIIWAALSGSLLMYAAIPFLMSSGWEPSDGSSTPLLPMKSMRRAVNS